MIWEKNVTVIAMLTREVENGRVSILRALEPILPKTKVKCDRYWPEMDCPLTCGPFKIVLIDEEETVRDEEITRRLLLTNMEV